MTARGLSDPFIGRSGTTAISAKPPRDWASRMMFRDLRSIGSASLAVTLRSAPPTPERLLPRYRGSEPCLSSFVWPKRSRTARRFLVRRQIRDGLVRMEWVPYAAGSRPIFLDPGIYDPEVAGRNYSDLSSTWSRRRRNTSSCASRCSSTVSGKIFFSIGAVISSTVVKALSIITAS
jgi:hypothetical protein